jgi:hypothetical protein
MATVPDFFKKMGHCHEWHEVKRNSNKRKELGWQNGMSECEVHI